MKDDCLFNDPFWCFPNTTIGEYANSLLGADSPQTLTQWLEEHKHERDYETVEKVLKERLEKLDYLAE